MNRSTQRGMSSAGLLIGLGILGAVGLGWWLSDDDSSAYAVDTTRLVSVDRRDVIHAVTASGRVEPRTRVAVMSRAGGIIQSLFVEAGDVVKDGQVLAQLDQEQLEKQLDQDQANLASAAARLSAAGARKGEAEGKLEDPELDFAKRNAERALALFASGDLTERERDEALQSQAMVRFRIDQIRNNIPVLDAAIEEAQANLDSSAAAVERTETALRETTITCPMDAVVLTRDREVGDGVSSILTAGGNATQIMSLGDLSEMYIEARVDEVDLGKIHVGMKALVVVDAFRSKRLWGVIERVAPAGSVDGNGIVTFEIRVTVEDPEGLLRPDMTADAKLILELREQVLALPQRAIQRGDQGQWLVSTVVGEGPAAEVRATEVTIGISDGLMTEVLTGVELGDQVLVPMTVSTPPRR